MQGWGHGLVISAATCMTPPSEGPPAGGLILYSRYMEIRDNFILVIGFCKRSSVRQRAMNGELGALAPRQSCFPPPPCFWGLMLRPLEPLFHSAFPPQPPRSSCCQPAPSPGSGMGRVKGWTGAVHSILGWGQGACGPGPMLTASGHI